MQARHFLNKIFRSSLGAYGFAAIGLFVCLFFLASKPREALAAPPSINMSASAPNSSTMGSTIFVYYGSSVTINWTSSNAVSCSINNGAWSGTSGSRSISNVTSGATVPGFCTSSTGEQASASIFIQVSNPSGTISVCEPGAQVVQTNQNVNVYGTTSASVNSVTWTASGGNPSFGTTGVSYTFTTRYTNPGTYSITARFFPGSGPGATDSCSVSVVAPPPPPQVTLSAFPSALDPGTTTTLTWSQVGGTATSCTATQGSGFSTGGAINGSDVSSALTVSTMFSVFCSGPTGSDSDSAYVTVNAACSPSSQATGIGQGASLYAAGGDGNYTWSAPGATPSSGSGSNFFPVYASTGDKTVTLTTGGQNTNCTVSVVDNTIPPVPSLAANPNPVAYNSTTTLLWSVTGSATSCTATQGPGFSTGNATSGSDASTALTVSTVFTVSCSGPGGFNTDSVTVNVLPTANLSAAPGAVALNGTTTLTWSSQAATSCTATQGPGFSTGNATSGSDASTALTVQPTTFTVRCSNAYGFTDATVDVAVGVLPAVTLTVSPTSGVYPTAATLTWVTANNPTSCTATGNWSGSKAVGGSNESLGSLPPGSYTYNISCSNASGSDTDSATLLITSGSGADGAITFSQNPCTANNPEVVCSPDPTVYWNAFGVTYGKVTVTTMVPPGPESAEALFDCVVGPNPSSSKTQAVTVGTVYTYRLYDSSDCVSAPGSGLTGTITLFWDSANGAVPAGWTCVSCSPGQAFYGVFPRAAASYDSITGADTHTHSLSHISSTTDSSGYASDSGPDYANAVSYHTHTWPVVASGSGSSLPLYKNLQVIQRVNPPTLPTGIIGMFETAVPSGWTRYSALDGRYVRGGPDNATGGSATHTHSLSVTSGVNSPTSVTTGEDLGSGVAAANGSHTHTVNGTIVAANNDPSYVNTVFGQLNAAGPAPSGLIGLFTAAPPAGWTTVSGGATYAQKLLKGNASFGLGGGSATHTHGGSQAFTSGGPSALSGNGHSAVGDGSWGVYFANSTHVHSATYGIAAGSSFPVYRDVILAKYNAFALLDIEDLTGQQTSPGPQLADLLPSNHDIVGIHAVPPYLSFSYLQNAEANIGNRTIGDGDVATLALHVVNNGSGSVDQPIEVTTMLFNLSKPAAGWNVVMYCNDSTFTDNKSCDGLYTLQADSADCGTVTVPVHDAIANQLDFVLCPEAGHSLIKGEFVSIVYQAKTTAPTGTTASLFRFQSKGVVTYIEPTDGNPVALSGGSLDTPPVLFFKGLASPFLKEVQ